MRSARSRPGVFNMRRVPSLNLHLVAVFLFGVTDAHVAIAHAHIDPYLSPSDNDRVRTPQPRGSAVSVVRCAANQPRVGALLGGPSPCCGLPPAGVPRAGPNRACSPHAEGANDFHVQRPNLHTVSCDLLSLKWRHLCVAPPFSCNINQPLPPSCFVES